MKRWLIFLHDNTKGKIKVISHKIYIKKSFLISRERTQIDRYTIFLTRKGIICDCQRGIYQRTENPEYCCHIKELLFLMYTPKIRIM